MRSIKSKVMMPLAKNQQPVLVTLLSCMLMTGCGVIGGLSSANDSTQASRSGNQGQDSDRLRRGLYGAIGVGVSDLEPDTSEVDGVDVSETSDTGYQLTLGVDVSKHLSLEIHTADLGSAEISPAGSIGYKIHGASALLYAGKNRNNYKRHGLLGYGRLGIGSLDNSSEGGVEFQQDNSSHVLFGAGLEYMTTYGLGVRGEVIAFDEDVFYGQLGLIYRLGRQRSNEPVEVAEKSEPVEKVAVAEPIVEPIAKPEIAPKLVPTPAPINVCGELNGVLEGVNFQSDSDKLIGSSEEILTKVADILTQCDMGISVTAHTDNQGPAEYNQALSAKRAISVVRFLVQKGINVKRFKARAFGESRPIATNETKEGRARNRRVELTVK